MPDFKFTMPDFAGSPIEFIKEARIELSKVVWPTRQQVINLTLTVIAVTALLGALLGGLDFTFTKLLGLVIK